jgi:hypothetical protein
VFYVEHQPVGFMKSKLIHEQRIEEHKRMWCIKHSHNLYQLIEKDVQHPFCYADGSGGDELIESEEMSALIMFCKARELRTK